MSSLPILQSLKESILTANVKAVYGEPIAAQGKTVNPVAKIIYGFGGGAGTGGVVECGGRRGEWWKVLVSHGRHAKTGMLYW